MQGVLGRAVRVGRPRALTGLPDAHSGPAFSSLVGLSLLASSGQGGDIRDLALPVARPSSNSLGMFGRLVSAIRGRT
jgi:cell division protein FtsA